MERSIIAAFVLTAFSLVVIYILLTPNGGVREIETFVNTAVTRASACNCLPGYIPSSSGGSYGCMKLGDPTVTRKCY